MFTLGLETSSFTASIALLQNEECLEERHLSSSGVRHAQSLVYELEQLVQNHQLNLEECQTVAVSIGPGSFTGLRIGVVCAKTLAFTVGCKLIPVDTLLAISENCPSEQSNIYAISDAQRGELYTGQYHREANGDLVRRGEIEIISGEQFAERVTESDLVCGPGLKRAGVLLEGKCQLAEPALWTSHASTVGRLSSKLPALSSFEELSALEPFYLRKSAAEENWEKKQNR